MRDAMYIDGVPLSNYGAVLYKWEITPILDNIVSLGQKSLPALLKPIAGQKTMKCTFRTVDDNIVTTSQSMTRLIGLLSNKTLELQMPDGYFYRSVATSIGSLDYPKNWIAEVMITFTCTQHDEYTEIDISQNNQPVYYSGTAPTGYKIKFTAPQDIQNITVQDIDLWTIPAGAKIVIDGINKTVTQNGINKFLECNLVDFPAFLPSADVVKISANPFVPLKIGFYPTYI